MDFVDLLATKLSAAGFTFWRDTDNLQPGTVDWERAIREAISKSKLVLLVASPNSVNSDYVHGELELARTFNLPIYPAWADGDEWIHCVPLNMAKYQYADCRNGRYEQGIRILIETLHKVFSSEEGLITLGLPTHETIEISLAQFSSGFSLANHIYLNHLQEWYKPFTYTREWILGNVKTKQLAIPWHWVEIMDNEARVKELIEKELSSEDRFPLSEGGFTPGSYWGVWDARRLKSCVLFLKTDEVRNRILSETGISELNVLSKEHRLDVKAIAEIDPSLYPYKIVTANMIPNTDRVSFVVEN